MKTPFQLVSEPIDLNAWREATHLSEAGGYCAFEGWVRDINDEREVRSLEYQAYPPLARRQGETILAEARERFDILRAVAVHRTGHLAVGDIAVFVAVASRHRADAFEACRYIVDNLKHRVPIWKKEHYTDGSSDWIDPTRCDCADPVNLDPSHQHHGHRHAH